MTQPTIEELKRELERLEARGRGDTVRAKLIRGQIKRLEYLEGRR